MKLNDYQEAAMEFAVYESPMYPVYALGEEVGEVFGLIAKIARGDNLVTRFGSKEAVREALMKELGDVLWQLSAVCYEFDMTLEEIAQMNLAKLADRKARDVLKGSGDNR